VVAAWKAKLHETHPDKGGNNESFLAVQRAFQEFKKERGL